MNKLRLQRLEPIHSYDSRSYLQKQEELVISKEAVKEVFQKVNRSFESLRLVRVPSLPIPAEKCVPIMPTRDQVLEYESVFLNSSPEKLQNMTVSEILEPYSYTLDDDVRSKSGKMQFLFEFFTRTNMMNVNLDVAVVCDSYRSENCLIRGLRGRKFNYKATSELLPSKRVYGVIVKMRKNDKNTKPVVRTDVDIVMVYDSAIDYRKHKLDMFKGATYEEPHVIYLSTMDTADIRLYESEGHTQLSWNSKLMTITHADQQRIFYQHNRKQINDMEVLNWNKFVANQVAQWASVKLEKNYHFESPRKKHPLIKAYISFYQCHPRNKNNHVIAQPITVASPQATNINKKAKPAIATANLPISDTSRFSSIDKSKSTSITWSTGTPNPVLIDSIDHLAPNESIHPDHLSLLVPLKRSNEVDVNDDGYGTSVKRQIANTNNVSDITDSQDETPSTFDEESSTNLSSEANDYSSFLQQALQQFEQEMLNISVKL